MNTASTAAPAASRRAPAAASAATATAPAPAFGLAALCDELAGTFAERASVIRALARAFLAGEHAFVLGKPGTGKSALARCFAQALGLSYWEYLMTRYSTPEELFGPLSIPELQKGRFTRNFAGYLPGAQVVFLDEIRKSNSGILNALLTALNERVFHDDGKPVRIPWSRWCVRPTSCPSPRASFRRCTTGAWCAWSRSTSTTATRSS